MIKISLIYRLFPYPDREKPGNEPGNQVTTIPATDRYFQAIHSFGSSNWRHSSSLSSTALLRNAQNLSEISTQKQTKDLAIQFGFTDLGKE